MILVKKNHVYSLREGDVDVVEVFGAQEWHSFFGESLFDQRVRVSISFSSSTGYCHLQFGKMFEFRPSHYLERVLTLIM